MKGWSPLSNLFNMIPEVQMYTIRKRGGESKDFKEKKNHCFRLDLCVYKTKIILRESLAMR